MKLVHIGFVVADIKRYKKHTPYIKVIKSLIDPIQKAHLELLDVGSETKIELIQPLEKEAFTWNFLQKGGGWHHLCYEVSSLKEARELISKYFMIEVRGPMVAPLLDGEVIFARDRNRQMVEFVWQE